MTAPFKNTGDSGVELGISTDTIVVEENRSSGVTVLLSGGKGSTVHIIKANNFSKKRKLCLRSLYEMCRALLL